MKMRAKIAAAAAVFCALGATAVFAEEFPGAAFIPIPETPITLQNPYVRKPVNPSDGGSSGGELSPNLLPWTGSPPSSIPCNPPSKFCSTRISNAPYCTGYTKAKVGMTCADVTRLFGLWDDYTAWINPDVDCSKPIPAGKNICVSGWFGFIPDDPSFSKGQKYPPVYGKSYQYCKKAGQMALTFDDGPHTFTPELLDFLKKEKVKATFFVNGMNHNCIYNATYVAMVRRAFNEGHQIASHSWSHPSLRGIYDTYKAKFGEAAGKDAVTAELERLERAFERIIGRRPKWLRPPFGEGGHDPVLEPIFRERGYMIAMWTFATLDANLDDKISLTTPSKFSNALISSLTHRAFYNGFYGSTNYEPGVSSHNVLMHDPLVRTVRELAPWVVKQMRDLGFTPVTVGQCAGVGSPAAWYHPPVSAAKRVFNATTWMCPEEKTRPRCWPWQGRCLAKKGAVTIPRPWTGAV